ncbi:MAG: hypothetical protein K2H15_05915, partial [Muribaculaceae bacterium]|nr:hypothetical protein [Muribaculaceae bacterium]
AEPEVIAIEEPEIPVRQTSGRVNEEHEVKSEEISDEDFNVDDIRIEVGALENDQESLIEPETGEEPTTGEYVYVDIDDDIIIDDNINIDIVPPYSYDDDFISPDDICGLPDSFPEHIDSDEDMSEDYLA